jgi:hypothetical protein
MRVLIACEFSGIVRDAFIARGHDAWSCDLLSTERAGPHIQGDVLEVIDQGSWDLMIAHPPCTYLSNSGVLRLYTNGKKINGPDEDRWAKMREAADFFRRLLYAPISKIAVENPVMHGYGQAIIGQRPAQTIQPWHFGDDASKATCLWLVGLPKLMPVTPLVRPRWKPCDDCDDYWCQVHSQHTADCACLPVDELPENIDPYDFYYSRYYSNQTPSGQNKLGPSPTRAKERSRTYKGIADAMAEQWG